MAGLGVNLFIVFFPELKVMQTLVLHHVAEGINICSLGIIEASHLGQSSSLGLGFKSLGKVFSVL